MLRSLVFIALGVVTLTAETIHLKTRNLEPEPDRTEYLTHPLKRRNPGRSHYLIQFEGQLREEHLAELRRRGVTVTGYVPDATLMIAAPDDIALDDLPVRWMGRMQQQDKISPLVLAIAGKAREAQTYVVEFHTDVNMKEARAMVREHGLRLIENPYLAPNHLLVTGRFGDFSRLAAWDEVAYIFPASRELIKKAPVHVCAGADTQQGTVAQYVTIGSGWPVTSPEGLVLNYVFQQVTEKLPAATTQSEILRAFNQWAEYARVNWVAASNPLGLQTVNVLFARGAHGDPYPFDGPGGVLAHTFYPAPPNPEPIAGDMHFDDDERWQVGADVDVYTVALHESGHALGLAHTDNPNDVMYPYYRIGKQLSSNDIAGVQSLYGARNGPPQTPANTPPPAPLNLAITDPSGTVVTTAAPSIAVWGTTTGGTGAVQVTWHTDGGQSGTTAGSPTWGIPSIPLNAGKNVISITATDAASDTATLSITVNSQPAPPQVPTPAPTPAPAPPSPPSTPQPPSSPGGDVTPPSLTITYPGATIFATTGSTVTFQGMATDDVGVTSVVWINSTGASGTATGTTLWTAKSIPLLEGNNIITVKAYDAAGNHAWRAVTVVRR